MKFLKKIKERIDTPLSFDEIICYMFYAILGGIGVIIFGIGTLIGHFIWR